MKTFIEQKAELRQQLLELENDNRRLQRQADDTEEAISENLEHITELYQRLQEVGTEVL